MTVAMGGGVKQRPLHRCPGVQVSVGVHAHDVGHGWLLPTTHGILKDGGAVVVGAVVGVALQRASVVMERMVKID